MNQKYKLGSANILDSKIWKKLVPLITDLKSDSFWKVGRGQVYFWSQKWWPMDFEVHQQVDLPDITVAEVWNDFSKKATYLAALPEDLQLFANTVHLNNSEDLLVWKGSDSGEFCSGVFRKQHSANNVERSAWWRKFWQPWIPTKISCFLWKCLNYAVPVDAVVQRAKVPFVSKCVCCVNGNQETLEHLFLEGEAARSIWSFLQGIFDINGHYPSFYQTTALWIQNSSTEYQFGSLRILAFAVAVWELWKWRNNSIYDHPEDHQVIKRRVIYQIQRLNCLIEPKRKASWLEEIAISCLHIPRTKVKEKRGKWVKWLPNPSDLTVNIHALAKENGFQGSFVVRNNAGAVFWCISRKFFGSQDLFQVLSGILKEAIFTVHNSGLRIAEIQSVDGKLIDCLCGRRVSPWRWISQVSELQGLCGSIELKCIAKEQNLVAVLAAGVDQAIIQDPMGSLEIRRAIAEDSSGRARWSG